MLRGCGEYPDKTLLDELEQKIKYVQNFNFPYCQQVSKYEIITKIGQGTFGEVFKAREKRNPTNIVAMKKILMADEKEGFPITALREIIILQKVEHKNVVNLKEICKTRIMEEIGFCAFFYLIFEFCDHDLAGLLVNSDVKFAIGEVKEVLRQMLNGVFYLHTEKILHRDLKAANILITKIGVLKIADFGLARTFSTDQEMHRRSFVKEIKSAVSKDKETKAPVEAPKSMEITAPVVESQVVSNHVAENTTGNTGNTTAPSVKRPRGENNASDMEVTDEGEGFEVVETKKFRIGRKRTARLIAVASAQTRQVETKRTEEEDSQTVVPTEQVPSHDAKPVLPTTGSKRILPDVPVWPSVRPTPEPATPGVAAVSDPAKPPPVVLHDKSRWTAVSRELEKLRINFSRARLTSEGIVIFTDKEDSWVRCTRFFEEAKLDFHTYSLKRDIPLDVIIKGIPENVDSRDVADDLTKQGFFVIDCNRLTSITHHR